MSPDRVLPVGPTGRSTESGPSYRELRRRHFVRLFLTYLAPVILLTALFLLQYHWIAEESRRLHLLASAENQANTLDLFLRERLANVSNLTGRLPMPLPPSPATMASGLTQLKQDSGSFVDIGFFDSTGAQIAYAGPYPALEQRDYGQEPWFRALRERPTGFVITDIYLGFRGTPHFTIGVSRVVGDQYYVLRATLDPQEIYDYVATSRGSSEVVTYIVNRNGGYQLVPAHMGQAMEQSATVPPSTSPATGTGVSCDGETRGMYAYSWLRMADWALITQSPPATIGGRLSGGFARILLVSLGVTVTLFCIIWVRAAKLARFHEKTCQAEAQLVHAAKLASVGELAAGIAHEINNPLAVITEEAGLAKDLISPEFDEKITLPEIVLVLERIEAAAFRCRDVTGKLLQFVRKTEVDPREHDVHELIDEVVDGLLGHEMAVSNIQLVKDYSDRAIAILCDRNQFQQVLVNLLNNAVDALNGLGRITIATTEEGGRLRVFVTDNGQGMTDNQLERIFLPFYTTKDVGKGTGLGLPVSSAIVEGMGGRIEVRSTVGKGSTFTIVLPVCRQHDAE